MAQKINRLGMVAFDHLVATASGQPLHCSDTDLALAVLDDQGCDTVLFALGWRTAQVFKPEWSSLRVVRTVLLGPEEDALDLHRRGGDVVPLTSVDLRARRDEATKDQVVAALPDRTFDGAACLFGAELNAFTMLKAEGRFQAPSGWQPYLDIHDIRVLLNPSATYMRRWEMKRKRAFISSRGRTVVSLWNRTTLGESQRPWTVFQDGIEVTGAAQLLPASDARLTLAVLDIPPVRGTY